MQALSARDLFYLYRSPHGDVAALRGLSLELAEGETVAALGPSGSGKSTLLSLAAGFLRPSSGELVVLGEHLERASRREAAQLRRRQIGIVRQHYHRTLPQELTVAEIVGLPSRLLGAERGNEPEYVAALLNRAGLAGRAHARPAELSGGEQQRVALCAALAKQPRLLLADEPTGELDAYTRDEVVELLVELTADTGAAALIVTHDPQVAERAQRTIHVRDGRLAGEGTDRPVLVVDEQGWVRLPRGLRRQARIGDRVRAEASLGKIELHAETPANGDTLGVDELPQPAAPPQAAVDGQPAVVLKQVVKRYGDPDPKPVIDLSWTAAARRLHVIAGPSGSGKTTLLNLIAALDRPDSGTISIGGRRVDALTPDESASFREHEVGYLSQHSTLIDYMSARENIELALTFRGHPPDTARTEAEQWLEWVGLGKLADRPAEQLSGGEQRRVALARALAPTPALLLADEPTAHLDQLAGRTVIQLLQNAVHEHGTTVIAASHDPDVINAADSLLNLDSPGTRPPTDERERRHERPWTTPTPTTNEQAKPRSGRGRVAALTLAGLVVAAAAIALGVTQPWNGSSGARTAALLQKLRAAIANPTASQVLYQQYTIPLSGAGLSGARGARLDVSSWTSGGAAPRHYRTTITFSGLPPAAAKHAPRIEAGATLGPTTAGPFTAYADNQLNGAITVNPPATSDAIDAIGLVRLELANPTPHHAPIVSIQAQLVHVQLLVTDSHGDPGTITYLANARTYKPVEIIVHNVDGISSVINAGGNLGFIADALLAFAPEFGTPSDPTDQTLSYRYETFTYEHATPAERRLANIQSAHPGAPAFSPAPSQTGQQCVRPFGILEHGHCVKTKEGAPGA